MRTSTKCAESFPMPSFFLASRAPSPVEPFVHSANSRPLGPHHFGTCEPAGLAVGRAGLVAGRARRSQLLRTATFNETADVPPCVAVILHYHCASLSRYTRLASSRERLSKRPRVAKLQRLGSACWAAAATLKGWRRGCGRWQAKFADHIDALRHHAHGQWGGSHGPSLDELECHLQHELPPTFHEASCAAAAALAAAGDVDSDTTAHVAAASRRLWEHWKLQPAEVPTLHEGEAHRVLSSGITLIRPLVAVPPAGSGHVTPPGRCNGDGGTATPGTGGAHESSSIAIGRPKPQCEHHI